MFDVWWLLLHHASGSTGKNATAALKAFLQASQAHALPASVLSAALTGHELTLKVCLVRLCTLVTHLNVRGSGGRCLYDVHARNCAKLRVQGLEPTLLAITTTSLAGCTPGFGEQVAATLMRALDGGGGTGGAGAAARLILQTLFGSVGASDAVVTDRALALLEQAATHSAPTLLQHSAPALTMLQSLDQLETAQFRSAFRVLGAMLVAEGAPDDDTPCDGAACEPSQGTYPVTAAVQQYLAAALGSSDALSRRVGVTGSLQWQVALALAGPEQAEVAKNKLETLILRVSHHSATLAFLCQELAHLLCGLLRAPGPVAFAEVWPPLAQAPTRRSLQTASRPLLDSAQSCRTIRC